MKDITRTVTSTLYGHRHPPLHAVALKAFHWITALLMFLIIPARLDLCASSRPRAIRRPRFRGAVSRHRRATTPRSTRRSGLLLFAIVAVRIVYRIMPTRRRSLPGRMAHHDEKGLSHASALAALRDSARHAGLGLHHVVGERQADLDQPARPRSTFPKLPVDEGDGRRHG